MSWTMQQPQEWKPDKSKGPSVAKVLAALVGIGAVVAALIAIF